MAETVLNYWKRKCYAEVLVFIGIIMGYFNHPLWELIFSIFGNLAVFICFVIVVLYKKKR